MKPLLLLPLSALYICSLTDNVFDVNKDGVVNSADVASFYNLVISGKDCDITTMEKQMPQMPWPFTIISPMAIMQHPYFKPKKSC